MVVSIVPIGNSKGIRIPKFILEELNISDSVDLSLSEGRLIVTPVEKRPRKGWREAFACMHERTDDKLLISDADSGSDASFGWSV